MVAGERRCPATSSSTGSMNPPLVGQVDFVLLFEPSARYRTGRPPGYSTATGADHGVRATQGTDRYGGELVGVTSAELVVVPGNHDVDRTRSTPLKTRRCPTGRVLMATNEAM